MQYKVENYSGGRGGRTQKQKQNKENKAGLLPS